MRAILVSSHGGVEKLEKVQVPEPSPAPDEVTVETQAVGLNHLDVWVRRGVQGHTFPLPIIPGSDVAGVVRATGSAVRHLSPGDPVIIAPGTSCGHCRACLSGRDHHCPDYAILGETRDGGCAEVIAVPAKNAVPKPDELSFAQGAALGVAFLTAWHMLTRRAQLQQGEVVLVQAGGSGVGSAAIQIAKLWNARVITTVGNPNKAERAAELGADDVIDYTTVDVAKEVRRLTDGRGTDIVIDHVGEATWSSSLKSLGRQGRLVICGATTGARVQLDLRHLFFKSQSLLGSTMGSQAELREVIDHASAGRLSPVVDRVLPLSDVARAHELLEKREVFGRVLLEP